MIERIEVAKNAGDLDTVNRLEAHLWLDGPATQEGRVGGTARSLFLDMNNRALRAGDVGEVTDRIAAWHLLATLQIPVRFARIDWCPKFWTSNFDKVVLTCLSRISSPT